MRKFWKVLLIISIVLLFFPKVATAEALENYVVFYNKDFAKIYYPIEGDTAKELIDNAICVINELPRPKGRGIGLVPATEPRGIKPVHSAAFAEYKNFAFAFGSLLRENENDIYLDFLQGDTQISLYSFENEHLIINFTKDVLKYGGSNNEYYLTKTLLESFLSIKEVSMVSFYIDNQLSPFCEGTVIFMEEYYEA